MSIIISRAVRSCLSGLLVSAPAIVALVGPVLAQEAGPPIVISSEVPAELNPPFVASPPSGGAPEATPAQAAAFAWQEFIALNWPAVAQEGQPGQRDTPSPTCRFGDPSADCGLLVWETYRHKVETFPGNANPFNLVNPPGYPGPAGDTSYGYDALPEYNYSTAIAACDPAQSGNPVPWINLDETDQITLASMYAGVVEPSSSPGNSAPQLIRFLAKSNRTLYEYVAGNSDPTDEGNRWWSAVPDEVVAETKAYLAANKASPEAGSPKMVSLPFGTIEVKAGWRPLNPSEQASGRFHTQNARFYEKSAGGDTCYRDATWGLQALHIIHKTPSAPYFIYATFEQADNILTAEGAPVEDANGAIILEPEPAQATTPQVCLLDPKPGPGAQGGEVPSNLGEVILTNDPATCLPADVSYCEEPGKRLYYQNDAEHQPQAGRICVDKRDNAIPDYVIDANAGAHAAIASYLQENGIEQAPWLSYKLVNVQYFPYDKIPDPNLPNGSLYTAEPPFSATNPSPSSYYQANIVVETNRSLQLFAGGLSPDITTEWNSDGTPHKNTYYGGSFHNMGGCMGCHGSQGQNPTGQAGDFSVILARGSGGTGQPETPAPEGPEGLIDIPRNRYLTR